MGETTVVADLREASVSEYCPLCMLILRSEERFLEALIYEQVNDIGGREVLRAARGFCFRHSGMLANSPAALGSSIIAHDVVRALQRVLAADDGGDGGRSRRWLGQRGDDRLSGQLAPSEECPACTRTNEMERVYLSGLLELLPDKAFLADYHRGSGVCLPHLQMLLRLRPSSEARAALLAHQAEAWHELELHLAEFVRKSDYRFTGTEQPTEDERDAWQRALRLLSGWRDDLPPPVRKRGK